TKEIQYLNAKGALTYTDIAGGPVLYGNLQPREISMKDVFRSRDSSKKFKIAEGQWYRYAPSYVSPAYHLLEDFPFIQEPPSGDLQERVLIRHHDYDQCFQSVQLLQWNSQIKLDRKSGSAGMPRPISYAVFCLKKKRLRRQRDGVEVAVVDDDLQ